MGRRMWFNIGSIIIRNGGWNMARRKLLTLVASIVAVLFFSCAGIADENKVIEEDYVNTWDIEVRCESPTFDWGCDVKVYSYQLHRGKVLLGMIDTVSDSKQNVYLRFNGELIRIGEIRLDKQLRRREAYCCFPKRFDGKHIATYYEKEPLDPQHPEYYRSPGRTWIASWYDINEGYYDHNLIPQAFFRRYRGAVNCGEVAFCRSGRSFGLWGLSLGTGLPSGAVLVDWVVITPKMVLKDTPKRDG